MRAPFRWSVGLTVLLLVAAILGGVAPAQPSGKKVPASLELIPMEGLAVATIHVAALHDSPVLAPMRDSLAKDQAFLKRIEADTGFTPDQIERITGYLPAASYPLMIDSPLIVITTRKPFDKAKVLKAWKATTELDLNAHSVGAGVKGCAFQPVPGGLVPPPIPGQPEKKSDQPQEEKPLDLNAPFYYVNNGSSALILIDDRTLAFLPDSGVGGGLALIASLLRKKADGPFTEVLAQADKHTLVAAVEGKHVRDTVKLYRDGLAAQAMVPMFDNNGNPIPPKPKDPAEKIEDEFTPYEPLFALERGKLTLDLGEKTVLTITAQFPTSDAATKAEPVAKEGLKTLVTLLKDERKQAADSPIDKELLPLYDFALGGLEKATVNVTGKTLTVMATTEVGAALKTAIHILPTKLQEAADRMKTQNNLKQIGIAIHIYHNANGYLPRDITDEDGKVLHSWRVNLLPYLEADSLYQKIDKTKPWDDPVNKKLWDQMPDVFKVPGREAQEKFHTYFQAFRAVNWVGQDDIWMVDNKTVTLDDITDGTSQTVAILEFEQSHHWMQPGDHLYDPKKLPKIGNPKSGKANAVMLDGTVITLDTKKYVGNKLTAILTVNGGEEVDLTGR
jgi:hypothetical protein